MEPSHNDQHQKHPNGLASFQVCQKAPERFVSRLHQMVHNQRSLRNFALWPMLKAHLVQDHRRQDLAPVTSEQVAGCSWPDGAERWRVQQYQLPTRQALADPS